MMGPEEWRELCTKQGSSVWSMIIQLLHFAAKEDPDEFRRRRDGIAEALFSPELSKRHRGQAGHRSSGGSSEHASNEEVFVPSGWTPHTAASVVTECRKDSSQATPPWTQSSQAGEGVHSRHGHTDAQKEGRTDHHLRTTCREPKPTSTANVRVCEGHSAELPLPAALPMEASVGRQGPPGNSLPPESSKDGQPHHRNAIIHQPFPREHIDRRHHETKDNKSRLPSTSLKDSSSILLRDVKTAPVVESTPEQQDDDGDKELYAVVEDVMDELLSDEMVLKRVVDAKNVLLKKDLPLPDIMSKLRELHNLPITMEILQSSQVGKAVTKIVRKNKSAEVQSLGSDLIRVWKELVSKTCSESEAAAEDTEATAQHHTEAESTAGEDQPHSWLAAPPLEDDVFAMDVSADLGLQNCLTDLDSLGSELSGSVASAGGHSLTNKTPESHRVFGSSESSPCETNRPLPGASTGAQPQSVLSESVKKAGWNETGVNSEGRDEHEKHQVQAKGPGHTVKHQSPVGMQKFRSHAVLTTTTQRHALPGPLRIDSRPAVPRPLLAKKPAQPDQQRLDLAKRKLHERSQEANEAKKFKTIQVVEDIAEPKPKAKGKPFFKHSHGPKTGSRIGQRL